MKGGGVYIFYTQKGSGGYIPDLDNSFNKQDLYYVESELLRLTSLKSSGCHISEIKEKCRGIVIGSPATGECVANAAILALQKRNPFSLIRLGDGEGNILGCIDPALDSLREVKWFNAIFRYQTGKALGPNECTDVAKMLEIAALDSDILGIRLFVRGHLPEWPYGPTFEWAKNAIERGDLRGALGMLRSLDQIDRWIESSALHNTLLTDAWVYIPLMYHLDRIINAASRVVVVSCRREIFGVFAKRYSIKSVEFLPVPIEPSRAKTAEIEVHYPDVFDEVLRSMNRDMIGTLVLVGAGILGKIYCHAAKQSGAVAIDIGSGFDILSGIRSRLMHNEKDMEKLRLL